MKHAHAAGFTLIEMAIVLAVIGTLALALTPTAVGLIHDARVARTRSDVRAISVAIVKFSFDNGFYPQWSSGPGAAPGGAAGKVDLLVSAGRVPPSATSGDRWTTGTTDLLEGQLRSNAPGYPIQTALSFGWNGPYLLSPLDADSWRNRYAVNIDYVDMGQGPATAGGAIKNAVWVISAGPDGFMNTPEEQPLTSAVIGGDDVGVRLQ